MKQNYAIDSNANNCTEAEKWTKLFFAIYNSKEMAFCLEDLKNAVLKLPKELRFTIIKYFQLEEIDNSSNVEIEKLNIALDNLKELDKGVTSFSVNSKIIYLKEQQQNVVHYSNYRQEWNVKIEDLNLSTRAINALHWKNILDLNDLFSRKITEIASIRNIGKKIINEEIIPLFKQHGVSID